MAADVCVVSGGVGAAKMLAAVTGVIAGVDASAIVNVGDDTTFHGLRVCPDLDTIMYTLAGAVNRETGWGLSGESWNAIGQLRRLAQANDRADIGWFGLGDLDLATHLYRTHRLSEGASLTQITSELTRAFGVKPRLLPATESVVATTMIVREREGDEPTTIGFQDYFVRLRHNVTALAIDIDGSANARCTDEVRHELSLSPVCIIAPSNPLVSIGPIRAISECEMLLRQRRERTVAVSPLIAGKALKGPADRLMEELGHRPDSVGVAELYSEIAATIVIDNQDASLAPEIERLGMRCIVTDTVMATPEISRALARTCLAAVEHNN